MGKINVLDISVANLIAAGEVVDRPASAVKELAENSIDAGAKKITVEIKNGGISLMRVTDDGCGMLPEDVPVSIKRHATSKIRTGSDLDGIMTLGFRGEALAAIASVSKLRIMTKNRDASTGVMMEAHGGEIVALENIGCPDGTTIIVEELFANVPARRKFLKKNVSEAGAVSAVVEKLALSHPEVAVDFISDGVQKFSTPGDGKLKNVIYCVLGRDFAKQMAEVRDETEGIEVRGYVGTPENVRGNRNYQNFFINGRYIKSATATAALEQAFRSYIPSDKFPSCVLNLIIHPAFVDVNVHPAKLEVKFSNEKAVFNAVYCAVRNALVNRVRRPEFAPFETKMSSSDFRVTENLMGIKAQSAEEASHIAERHEKETGKFEQIRQNFTASSDISDDSEYNINVPLSTPTDSGAMRDFAYRPIEEIPSDGAIESSAAGAPESELREFVRDAEKDTSDVRSPIGAGRGDIVPDASLASAPQIDAPIEVPLPPYRIAGIMFECYVFVELENSMLVIDKHAAHERIIFERLKQNMRTHDLPSQMLLVPVYTELSPTEEGAAQEYGDEIRAVGYDFTTENRGVNIVSMPSGLEPKEAIELFRELVARLADGTTTVGVDRNTFCERALFQASCKAAVKAGRVDGPEHIKWIVEQLLTHPNIKYCPHGRPVAFEMSKSGFESRFERK